MIVTQQETGDPVAAHRASLVSYALRMTGDLDEAEDVVQSVIARALQVRPAPTDWRSFLYRMTHNAIVDQRRRRTLWQRVRGCLRPQPPAPQDRGLLQALAELGEPYRSTLTLRFLQRMKLSEVAEIKSAPLGTIKAQVARGLRLLRERIGDQP